MEIFRLRSYILMVYVGQAVKIINLRNFNLFHSIFCNFSENLSCQGIVGKKKFESSFTGSEHPVTSVWGLRE